MKLPDRPDAEVSVIACPEAEEKFLACMMMNMSLAPNYVWFPATGFYGEVNRKVWQAIQSLHSEGKEPAMSKVSAVLIDQGMPTQKAMQAVSEIIEYSMLYQPLIEDADAYFKMIVESDRKRRMDEFAQRIRVSIRYPGNDWKTTAQQQFAEIFQDGADTENPFISIADLDFDDDDDTDCIQTGLPSLDHFLDGGIKKGELTLIAARTSMGKSAFMCWLAIAAAHKDRNVQVVSVEMEAKRIHQRWLGAYGNYPYKSWRYASLEVKAHAKKTLKERGYRISINCKSKTAEQILAGIRRDMMTRPVDMIFVDHLHHVVSGSGQDERNDAAKFVTALKNLAMENNTAIVLLAQLNRGVEGRNDKRPSLSDIREFGATEQIVDLAMMLYRDEYYNPQTVDRNVTEIIIPKNRNGQTSPGLKVLSDLATNRYYDFSPEAQSYLDSEVQRRYGKTDEEIFE